MWMKPWSVQYLEKVAPQFGTKYALLYPIMRTTIWRQLFSEQFSTLLKILTVILWHLVVFLLLQSALQPLWVLTCTTIVDILSRKVFTECRCQRHVKTPTRRTSDLKHSNSHHKESPAYEMTQANPSSGRWNHGRERAENFAASGDTFLCFGN